MRNSYGPVMPFSDELHQTKYRQEGEDFRDAMSRVANGLKDNDSHFHAFRNSLLNMRFMPAGRIQAAIGARKSVTPYNCYVSGTIEDSYVHGEGSIMQRALEAAATMRMGGGIGYNFGTLRPRNDLIAGLGSNSSGPISFMEIYDAVCRATSSSGHRRGAQMGVMPIWHPDAPAFVHAKQPDQSMRPLWKMVEAMPAGPERDAAWWALQSTLKLTGFNISLAVTDEFMEAKAAGRSFDLRFKGRVYQTIDPQELWEEVMRSTWDWAEPGVLFIDTINRMNNLYYCEEIAATNPCGEQPLPPYGACLLGSFNLPRYLVRHGTGWDFDWDRFVSDIPHVVRAMDNVVDRARYPLVQQEMEAKNKRRMGLGVTGLANCGEALGAPYGSQTFLAFEAKVLEVLRDEAYLASSRLAGEKGSFPLYDADKYLAGEFIKTLPEHVRASIRKHGIRNSHLLSIAPTGTISLAADNTSSSIEPVFSYGMERTVMEMSGPRKEVIEDYGVRVLGVKGKRSADVTVQEHLDVLATAAHYMDSACSKTINCDGKMPWDQFKGIYDQSWERGIKGVTTYNADGKRSGVIVSVDEKEAEQPVAEVVGDSCTFDPQTGRRSCE